jgi:hypothetical protein
MSEKMTTDAGRPIVNQVLIAVQINSLSQRFLDGIRWMVSELVESKTKSDEC